MNQVYENIKHNIIGYYQSSGPEGSIGIKFKPNYPIEIVNIVDKRVLENVINKQLKPNDKPLITCHLYYRLFLQLYDITLSKSFSSEIHRIKSITNDSNLAKASKQFGVYIIVLKYWCLFTPESDVDLHVNGNVYVYTYL